MKIVQNMWESEKFADFDKVFDYGRIKDIFNLKAISMLMEEGSLKKLEHDIY